MAKAAKKTSDKTPEKAKAKPDTVTIKVTEYYTSVPLVLRVNRKDYRFPIDEEVTVPKHVEAVMASVSGVTYETTK